jgi:hypothetical protein
MDMLWDRCRTLPPNSHQIGADQADNQEVEHGQITARLLKGLGIRVNARRQYARPIDTFCDLAYFHD